MAFTIQKSSRIFTFKSQEFYVYPVINEEKTGIITLPNVLIKLMIYDLQNVTKEMQWYKLTNPSAMNMHDNHLRAEEGEKISIEEQQQLQ